MLHACIYMNVTKTILDSPISSHAVSGVTVNQILFATTWKTGSQQLIFATKLYLQLCCLYAHTSRTRLRREILATMGLSRTSRMVSCTRIKVGFNKKIFDHQVIHNHPKSVLFLKNSNEFYCSQIWVLFTYDTCVLNITIKL